MDGGLGSWRDDRGTSNRKSASCQCAAKGRRIKALSSSSHDVHIGAGRMGRTHAVHSHGPQRTRCRHTRALSRSPFLESWRDRGTRCRHARARRGVRSLSLASGASRHGGGARGTRGTVPGADPVAAVPCTNLSGTRVPDEAMVGLVGILRVWMPRVVVRILRLNRFSGYGEIVRQGPHLPCI